MLTHSYVIMWGVLQRDRRSSHWYRVEPSRSSLIPGYPGFTGIRTYRKEGRNLIYVVDFTERRQSRTNVTSRYCINDVKSPSTSRLWLSPYVLRIQTRVPERSHTWVLIAPSTSPVFPRTGRETRTNLNLFNVIYVRLKCNVSVGAGRTKIKVEFRQLVKSRKSKPGQQRSEYILESVFDRESHPRTPLISD